MNIETMTEEQAEAQHLAYQRERRERIATAVFAGILSGSYANSQLLERIFKSNGNDEDRAWAAFAQDAAHAADALIAELDKQP